MEMQKVVSFALLSHRTFCASVNNNKYIMSVSVFLTSLSSMQITPFMHCIISSSVVCLVYRTFLMVGFLENMY